MTPDQSWVMRGMTAQTWSVMQSLIAILDDKRLTQSRIKDLSRQLKYLAEQVDNLEPGK